MWWVSQPLWAKTVVVTLPPLGALIAPFLDDNDRLVVLLNQGASPHGFEFRPSQRMAVSEADVLVSVGTPVDVWANDAFAQARDQGAQWVRMTDSASVFYPKRGLLETSPQAAHDHHGHHHHEGEDDGHIWLSPTNASAFLNAFAKHWSANTPQATAQRLETSLAALSSQVDALARQLSPVSERPYLVLHDAYQYFEKHFNLNYQGAIQLSPMIRPGVRHVLELREKIASNGIQCVLKDPQFPQRQVAYVVKDLSVRIGTLDPLGHTLWPDAEAIRADEATLPYARFLQALADGYTQCLAPT
jgi:zinc transport system substrate-binding protein